MKLPLEIFAIALELDQQTRAVPTVTAFVCSLEEFTGLMKGQIAARNMDDEIKDTFAVFGSETIDPDLLRLMVKVAAAPCLSMQYSLPSPLAPALILRLAVCALERSPVLAFTYRLFGLSVSQSPCPLHCHTGLSYLDLP
jgi:hypothetical protein